jgi:hypothetical protein
MVHGDVLSRHHEEQRVCAGAQAALGDLLSDGMADEAQADGGNGDV